jgi:hypothetical protein
MRRLVLAALLSCTPLQFAVDPAFVPDEQAEVRKAAADWNARTVHPITFDGTAWRVLKQDPGTGYNGITYSSKHLILISAEHPGATVYSVALHEFGHALGLQHTTTGVMQAAVVSTEFTPEVLAECKRVSACR